jgi:uncharacterized protein YndB with AHSA1/START domain
MELHARTVRPTARIYKTITLNTSRGRAWRAISEPHELGAWLGASFDAAFHRPLAPGVTVTGLLAPSAAGAAALAGEAGTPVELTIVNVDPDHRVSFLWHPFALEPGPDARARPMTLVELQLETEPEGVVITATESGFGRLSRTHLAKVLAASSLGWEARLEALKSYVEGS